MIGRASLASRLLALASTYHEKRERLEKGSPARQLWNELRPYRQELKKLGYRVTAPIHGKIVNFSDALVFIYRDTDIRIEISGDTPDILTRGIGDATLQAEPQQITGEPTDVVEATEHLEMAMQTLRKMLARDPTAQGIVKALKAIQHNLETARHQANFPEFSSEA